MINSQKKLITKRLLSSFGYNRWTAYKLFRQPKNTLNNTTYLNQQESNSNKGRDLYYPKYGCSWYDSQLYHKQLQTKNITFPMFTVHSSQYSGVHKSYEDDDFSNPDPITSDYDDEYIPQRGEKTDKS